MSDSDIKIIDCEEFVHQEQLVKTDNELMAEEINDLKNQIIDLQARLIDVLSRDELSTANRSHL